MKNKEAKAIFSSLENFSSIPPPELWDKIEAELDKPKKKNRPIIWWWIAAGLIAGFSLPTILYVNSNQGNQLELNIESNDTNIVFQKESNEKESNEKGNENKNKIVISNTIKKNILEDSNNKNNTIKKNQISLSNSNVLKNTESLTPVAKNKNVARLSQIKEKSINKSIAESKNNTEVKSTMIANNYQSNSSSGANNFTQLLKSDENNKTIENTVFNSKKSNESIVYTNPKSNIVNQNKDNSVLNHTIKKESSKNNDSIHIIQKEVAQLEKALADLEKNKNNKKNSSEIIDKWSLQVFAGVMSSENYTNEKSLGNVVSSKQSNGYGVKTNYKLNKKWAVSSGFKINELGQKIDGVSYYERSNSESTISGLFPFSSDKLFLDNPSNTTVVFASTNENYLFAQNSKEAFGFETGNVTQNLKYFEMPVEVSYMVLNKKKTNINMNTGGFVGKLISNELLLNGASIGENKNVNEYVYGTLLSSTVQYEFYKKTKVFIEPGMNYYINPLESQSFNKFQWMFNFGLNLVF